jgi:hypothetical protein
MKSIVLAIGIAMAPAVALADTFEFTVTNGYTDAVTGVSISGGKAQGFKRIPAGASRSFTVVLPDGDCEASLTLTFEDGNATTSADFDFCQFNEFEVYFE